MRALPVAAAALVGLGGAALVASVAVAATDDTPPPSNKTLVGIMVDSKDGLTESTIDCRRDGKHQTVDGDGTLFMPNLDPHRVVCVINIRYKGTVT